MTNSNPDRHEDLSSEEIAWLNIMEHDDLAKCLNGCMDQWKNAGPEAWKKMYALFTIAGIFLAVCHHRHVLVICDMIRSGEFFWHIHFSNPYVSEWSIHWRLSIDYFRILDLTYVSVMTLCALSAWPLNKAPLARKPWHFVSVALFLHFMVIRTIMAVRWNGTPSMWKE